MVLLLASNVTLAGGWAGSLTASSLVALRAALQVVYYGGLLASIVWFARRKGVPFMRSVGLVRFGWVGSAAWVVAAFALLVVAYVMYGFLAQTLGWEPVGGGVTDLTGWFGTDVVGLAFAIGTVVLLTPFVEEVVFRGVVLGALRRHVSAPVAVVASALVFAVSHTTPWMMVPHTLLGVALGWMTVARGSVWPAVALHTLYNGAVVAAVYSIGGRGV
jgi:membrane protease YdiL (CAAX protease family)